MKGQAPSLMDMANAACLKAFPREIVIDHGRLNYKLPKSEHRSVADRRGGWSKDLSNQKGLTGTHRREFIASGISTCKNAQRNMPDNKDIAEDVLESYCECLMTYVADRISPTTMMEISKQKPSAIEYLMEQRKASGDFCIKQLPGFRGE